MSVESLAQARVIVLALTKGKSSQKFQQEALNKGQRMLTIHAKEKSERACANCVVLRNGHV